MAIGLVSGLIGSSVLTATLGHSLAAICLASVVGIAGALASTPRNHSDGYIDRIMTSASFGIGLWCLFSVIVLPLLGDGKPHWTASGMRILLPQLVGWIIYGSLLGFLIQSLSNIAAKWFGLESQTTPQPRAEVKNIVILGGGFAGMCAAQNLESLFGNDASVSITLISDTNALLFTPMLAEAAGSSIEPTHISSPLRTSLRRTRVIRSRVTGIDEASRIVTLSVPEQDNTPGKLAYDHLVLALGSVSNYFGMQNIQKMAYDFKTLLDSIRIRNRVIALFEAADRQSDSERRRELLTFVIAGGGFAGVELAGALNDFARGMLADYPSLHSEDIRVILVHSRERILPELSEDLADYALERMAARGVIFKLNTRLTDVRPGLVLLSPDETIRAQTLIWTAGTAPNPLLRAMGLQVDKRGAAIVDAYLAVPGHDGMWALGDCSAAFDARSGKPCPPTAQFALREARTVARNIFARVKGKTPQPFHFNSLGALCVVGHQTACAELAVPLFRNKKVRFSGLLAWFMWRAIYLAKLPGRERKIRVSVDWIIELFFPRDIVQTIDFDEHMPAPDLPADGELRKRSGLTAA